MSGSGAETLVSGGFATWRVSGMFACRERLGKQVVCSNLEEVKGAEYPKGLSIANHACAVGM